MIRLTSLLILMAPGLAARGDESWLATRSGIDAGYRQRLESLAARCDELGLPAEARITRAWFVERDPGRQYLFVMGDRDEGTAPVGSADLTQKWFAKFWELRRAQAAQLFELARQQAGSGSATVAFQLLHEVVREDSQHAEARRILELAQIDELRPRSRASRLAHPLFGWPRGRWWQIESRHYQIVTDHSAEAGIELARRLEDFHSVWRQLFFEYWTTPAWLRERFDGESLQPRSLRKRQIVLFRHREEYIQRLAAAEPQIAVTLGYYRKANQTAYFHAGDESLLSVWYHEATHQLFQETGSPDPDVGEKWNFWVVEGIAAYFESFVQQGNVFVLGGFDAERLQFTRSRVMGGEPQMPLEQLVRLGREDLQRHPEIRRLYTQSAGLTHFFMDFERGKYRDAFVKYLFHVYRGNDSPGALAALIPVDPERLDRELRIFLTVGDADLRFLGPAERRRNLSLVRGNITDDALARLSGSSRLEWLDLSFTGISDQGIPHLASLGGLKRLTLVRTRIGDAAATVLAGLAGLEELDVSGTAITDASLPQLAKLTRLKVLRVAHTAVSDAGLVHLAALGNLEELDVEQSAVTDQALARLRQQLPGLK